MGYDIHEVTKLSAPRFLYRNFFDAAYIDNTDSSSSIIPVPGNQYFEDFTIELNDVHPLSPDVIQSNRGNSIPVLKYSDSDNTAMLFNIKDEGKVAYLAVGLEQISNEEHRDILLSTVMAWFNTPVDVEKEITVLPEIFSLRQNYPNPFNPVTKIQYSIPAANSTFAGGQVVSLKVYDILGRLISTLVNQKQSPGNYEVEFSAEELNSGIYFYELKTGSNKTVKKMMLIK